MSIARSASLGFAARLLVFAATAATHFVLAAELGPGDYGAIVLVLFLQGTMAIVANFGLGSALSYYLGQDGAASRRYILAGAVANLAIGLVVLVAAWPVLLALQPLLLPDLTLSLLAVCLVSVPFRLAYENLVGICVGLGLVGKFVVVLVAGPLAWLSSLLVLGALGLLSLEAALVAWLGAQAAAAVLAGVATLRAVERKAPVSAGAVLAVVPRLVRLGGEQTLSQAAWWLLVRSNRAIIGAVLGAEAVGRFGIAAALGDVLLYVPTMVSVSIFHRLATADPKTATNIAQRSVRVAAAAVALLSLILLPVASVALSLFLGPDYADAPLVLAALVPGHLALVPYTIIGGYFVACFGRPAVNLLLTCLALATQVPLMLAFTHWWGLPGAALGTSAGYVVAGLVALALFARRSRLGCVDTLFFAREDVALLTRWLLQASLGQGVRKP